MRKFVLVLVGDQTCSPLGDRAFLGFHGAAHPDPRQLVSTGVRGYLGEFAEYRGPVSETLVYLYGFAVHDVLVVYE